MGNSTTPKATTPKAKTPKVDDTLLLCQSLSVASKETGISLVKKEVATIIDSDFRSLSQAYKSLLKNRDQAIRYLEVRGQKIDANALHQILFAQNLKLFTAFLTDKQRQKSNFSGSEVLSVLSRAVATSKKATELRVSIPLM